MKDEIPIDKLYAYIDRTINEDPEFIDVSRALEFIRQLCTDQDTVSRSGLLDKFKSCSVVNGFERGFIEDLKYGELN